MLDHTGEINDYILKKMMDIPAPFFILFGIVAALMVLIVCKNLCSSSPERSNQQYPVQFSRNGNHMHVVPITTNPFTMVPGTHYYPSIGISDHCTSTFGNPPPYSSCISTPTFPSK